MNYFRILFVFVLIGLTVSCKNSPKDNHLENVMPFNKEDLSIKTNTQKQVSGQVIYLPVYSNIPYYDDKKQYELSAFVAVHNTDFDHSLTITKILFFDNDGNLIANHLKEPFELKPLATKHFTVKENNKNGLGSNFIVEWKSEQPISEPLVESVMVGMANNQGVSLISQGRVVREK